jgi:hypothetical protein
MIYSEASLKYKGIYERATVARIEHRILEMEAGLLNAGQMFQDSFVQSFYSLLLLVTLARVSGHNLLWKKPQVQSQLPMCCKFT